jgi:hypothetical protein
MAADLKNSEGVKIMVHRKRSVKKTLLLARRGHKNYAARTQNF